MQQFKAITKCPSCGSSLASNTTVHLDQTTSSEITHSYKNQIEDYKADVRNKLTPILALIELIDLKEFDEFIKQKTTIRSLSVSARNSIKIIKEL